MACGSGLAWLLWWRVHGTPLFFLPSRSSQPRGTLVDAFCVEDVVRLVRLMDRGAGVDDLAERMEKLLKTFPPTDAVRRRLRDMLDTVLGSGGEEEFCVMLLFVLSSKDVPTGSPPP